MSKSDWEQLDDDANNPAEATANELNNPSSEPASSGQYDVQDEEQEAPAAPKKNLKPLLLAMGIFVIVLLAGMGYALTSMFSSPKAPSPSQQGMVVDAATPVVEPASQVVAAPESAPLAPVPAPTAASEVASSPVAASKEVTAPPVPLAAPEQDKPAHKALVQDVDQLKSKADAMQAEIDQIKRELASRAKSKASAVSAAPSAARQPAKAHAHKAKATSLTSKAAGVEALASSPADSKPAQVAPAVEPKSSLDGLSLRAVYPPSGADMQAWVMDAGRVTVLNKGSVIRGAKVLAIESDRVITDRGLIR